jgi:hypothetical protein
MATTDKHTTMEELLWVVFSVQPVMRLYNEGQLPLGHSLSLLMAARRVEGWCKMAASLRVSQWSGVGE